MREALDAAFEKARDAIVITSVDGTVRDWNSEAVHMFQRPRDAVRGKSFARLCRESRRVNALLSMAREEGYAKGDLSFDVPDRTEIIGHTSVLRVDEEKHQELLLLIADITEQRKAEQALREEYQLFEIYAQYSPAALWMGTAGGTLKLMSAAFETITGMNPSDLTEFPQWLAMIHSEDRPRFERNIQDYTRGERIHHRYRILRKGSGIRWIQSDGFSVRDEKGEISYVGGFLQDITEQHHLEVQLREALLEKEMLLQEVHHRIKNNLQIISSLLRLQSVRADPQSTLVLRESCARVDVIAALHDHLHQTGSLSRVSFPRYVKRLIRDLATISDTRSEKIRLNVQVAPIELDPKTAVLCALILNELVSNSFRHAFPGGRAGQVDVLVEASSGVEIVMTVRDNGVGVPPGFQVEQVNSLGLKLVRKMAQRLNGSLAISNRQGMMVEIRFPTEQRP